MGDVTAVVVKHKKEKKEKKSKNSELASALVGKGDSHISDPKEEAGAEQGKKLHKEKKEKKRKHTDDETLGSTKAVSDDGKKGSEDAAVVGEGKDKKSKKSKKSSTAQAVQDTAKSNTQAAVDSDKMWTFKETVKVPESTISEFLSANTIRITSLNDQPFSVQPILQFKQANFPAKLHSILAEFPAPTFIQSVTWPPILQGRDLVGIAATGSGKTLAFGVPALLHIQNSMAKNTMQRGKPLTLVLSPTRELAMQIQDQLSQFGKAMGIKSVCIYGGMPKWEQRNALKQGMHVIVATPGRLIDLFEEDSTICDLSQVTYLVLDEADRMLDIGFEEAIKKIVARLPTSAQGRQTVMFSATWPQTIQRMAMMYLNDPVKVTVGSTDLSANISIEQRVEVLDPMAKETRLLQLLKDYHKSRTNRVLIFALYKKEASRLEQLVRRNGYNVAAIHGDLSQIQRTAAIDGFRSGKCPLLIATDVAARGIDIPNVEYVINVTFPLTVEDYCHRIGRTGRAGKTGISHTLFTLHDKGHSGGLINILKQAKQPVPPELLKFGTTTKRKVDPNYGVFAKDVDMTKKGTKITFAASDDEDE
ncbi:hypothetical protein BASA61_003856 [Batrachochytrium salamandrivorans]|nr:hypothetical protein BASA61_003856 [Batrachochytrium salamandrivorans]KAH9272979.1 hypothetical protein BASA83_004872 [Batrachochytrium salamandrivorans]